MENRRPNLHRIACLPIDPTFNAMQMAFYTANSGPSAFPPDYHGDAFVALHGSWNRATRTGYKLVRIPIRGGVPTGGYEDFLTGFVTTDRNVWGRPVGVTVAHDGALLMTEDANGTIWRIAYAMPRLAASIVEENGQKFLVVTITRAAPAAGVTHTVEFASSLLAWAGSSPEMAVLSETPTQIVLRGTIPIQNMSVRFIRVRVTNQ